MNGEKFVDKAKRELMYEYEAGGDVECMLEQTDTNSRVNEQMARWCLLVKFISGNWKGGYKGMFDDMVVGLQRHYLNMDGYSRVQAIEMCQAHTITDKNLSEKREKGGILGLFSK